MRYGLKAAVEGTILLKQPLTTETDDVRTEFLPNERGFLTSIVVSTRVDAEAFAARIGPGIGDAKLSIELKGDRDVTGRLLRFLQSLESHLSFSSGGGLARIFWETAEQLRTPEADDEGRFASIPSWSLSFIDPRPKVFLRADAASKLAEAAARLDHPMLIPKAFWREAINEYCERRYIQAFYNFYFVVEGLFARGKSSESAVVRAFTESMELTHIAEWAVQSAMSDPRTWEKLQAFYEAEQCSCDAPGTIRLLVRMRGRLHHYHQSSTKEQAQPFSQDSYQCIAWLAMHFATATILKRDKDLPQAMPL